MSRADVGPPLLALARGAIARALGAGHEPGADGGDLTQKGATFVTLRRDGALRGCIGTVTAWRSLADDVRANALAAAFHDPRFPPLARLELALLSVEVSLLHPAERLAALDEEALAAALRPGVDGVVLECAGRRATFLPQVWEQLPAPRDFVRALKRKAGFGEDFWNGDVRVSRYTVDKFFEGAP
jgi:AmmeMemoRadiSam system protein A